MSEPGIPAKSPRHWLEYISTAVAVIVSLSSLWVAIGSERANRQMVEASSWPLLEVYSSNVDDKGRSVLQFLVVNTGVGPAKVRSFEVFYKGRPYRTAVDLIRGCCNAKFTRPPPSQDDEDSAAESFITGGTAGYMFRAGEQHAFIVYGLRPQSAETWHALDHARDHDITYRVCYCSVFDECWINTVKGRDQLDPVRTDKCPAPAVPYTE